MRQRKKTVIVASFLVAGTLIAVGTYMLTGSHSKGLTVLLQEQARFVRIDGKSVNLGTLSGLVPTVPFADVPHELELMVHNFTAAEVVLVVPSPNTTFRHLMPVLKELERCADLRLAVRRHEERQISMRLPVATSGLVFFDGAKWHQYLDATAFTPTRLTDQRDAMEVAGSIAFVVGPDDTVSRYLKHTEQARDAGITWFTVVVADLAAWGPDDIPGIRVETSIVEDPE